MHGLLEASASSRPGKPALRDDKTGLSFSDWLGASLNLASLLREAGVREGDTVGVRCGKTVMLPVSFTAISSIGCRFMSVSPDWPETAARKMLPPSPRSILLCFSEPQAGPRGVRALRFEQDSVLEGRRTPDDLPQVRPDDDFYMNVTSASTGLPKVAPVSQRALLSNTLAVCLTLGLTHEDVHMSLFSASGHPHELFMRGLLLGGTTILTEGRYPRSALRLISEAGVTALMGLPPQLDGLARVTGREDSDIGRLRIAEAGGMHSSQEFLSRFHALTGVDVVPVWGSTETSGVALCGDANTEGLSRVVDGYGTLLAGLDGTVLEGDGEGELRICGEAVVRGYAGDRMSSEEHFRDGWFLTGDIFRRGGGALHFLGRRGGLIKSAGQKVFPLEVELAVLRHPDVLDVAVSGEEYPGRGETVVARVVPRPGSELQPAALREFLRSLLDHYKIPHKFHLVPDLPRTPGGKIDRKALGSPPSTADWKGELLRTDVEIVRLLNHRASTVSLSGTAFDPGWVEEQLENAAGHNPGPMSDDAVRSIMSCIIHSIPRQ